MKLYGAIIVENGVKDIFRAIDSIANICDEIFIIDCYSTDGTWEALNSYKEAYNLRLIQETKDREDRLKNKLLKLIPKNSWVINLNQDEKLNVIAQYGIKDFIEGIDRTLYDSQSRKLPLVIDIKIYFLFNNISHYREINEGISNKIFFNDKNIHFLGKDNSYLSYDFFTKKYETIKAPDDWAIFNYNFLKSETKKKNYLYFSRLRKVSDYIL